MKSALGQIMRQAQQMQENLKRVQDQIAQMEITGESGAGLVKVTLSGKHQARRVEIAAEAMQEGREFLEDLIAAAINDAAQKLEEASKAKMAQATAGMQLPPGFAGLG
ncbi:YbaB/EbfC family nucleoid-associated protein [Fontimonas sp. SYSU GA230001]|uniref:YbaB/EbfC family nucleoid-associated protein n=1 Tax=Fontimonas sp. SYSU GA230001 TaxID=3142450 RepID=UPI0032B44610